MAVKDEGMADLGESGRVKMALSGVEAKAIQRKGLSLSLLSAKGLDLSLVEERMAMQTMDDCRRQ